MPEQDHSPRYDLTVLQPLLDQGFIILTPTVRLARRISREWNRQQASAGHAAWQPLPVQPLEAFLGDRWREALLAGRVPARVRLSPLQLGELWRQVIDEDFTEREEAALLQPAAAAELAQQARETLLRWRIDVRAPAPAAEFRLDADCASFARWLLRFDGILREKSMASSADLLVDLLTAPAPDETPPVALLDFDDVPPLFMACLEQCCGDVRRVSGARTQGVLDVHGFPERNAELQAVARWAADHFRRDPGLSLGIILADSADRGRLEYLLRREFDCLGQNYTALPVNFSTGIALEQAPVVRDALLALGMAQDSAALQDVLGLLGSRFIAGDDSHKDSLVTVLRQLYRDGRRQVTTARLRYLCQQDDEDRLRAAAALQATAAMRLRNRVQFPSAWADTFRDVLDHWGWPGDRTLDSLEHQQVRDWYETLDLFAGCDELHGELGYSPALALLRRLCQGQVSQPETADSPIQVMGPLEAAGLHFERLWWVGLQGSRWPSAPRPNPFLPIRLQQRSGMPHASSEREWQYAAALLQQYLGASPQVRVSYARHIDGIPDLPSPLVAGVAPLEHDAVPSPSSTWAERLVQSGLSGTDDRLAPAVTDETRGQLTGGAAILAAQAACPFRSFAAHRLDLEPLQAPVTGLSAAERGKLLHEALYVLWGEIGDSARLASLDSASQASVVRGAIDTALSGLPATLRLLAGAECLQLERTRLETLLNEWLALERKRAAFTVVAREQTQTLAFAGLPLTLRLDRVDCSADGQRLLIDYKSGRCRLGDWLGERVREPQLPLYAVVSGVDGLAFAQVRPRDCRFIGLGTVEGTPGVATDLSAALGRYALAADDWETLTATWARDLENIARSFLDGVATVDPQRGACDYCGFRALCRVGLDPEPSP